MSDEKKKSRTLDLPKKAKVFQWLNENHEWLQSKPQFTEVARRVSHDLGFGVSPVSVHEIAKAFGMDWEPKFLQGGARQKKIREKFEELDKKLKELALHADIVQLRAECASLRGLVSHLYAKLGEKPPSGHSLSNIELPAVLGKVM